MTSSEPRKRQPAETRQLLLDVVAETIREKGMSGVTLEGVARSAGMSKGGLLHHFPSKQDLIDALIVDLHQEFLEKLKQLADEDPEACGRRTRAYLNIVTRERDERARKVCNIIAVEDRQNQTMRELWREFLVSLLSSKETGGADPITLAIVQLATDGLWLADLEGMFDHLPGLHEQIVERLEQMTKQPAAAPEGQ